MNNPRIRIQVASCSDFDELLSEMWVEGGLIGHVQQENPHLPPEVVFYPEAVDFPERVRQQAARLALEAHPDFTPEYKEAWPHTVSKTGYS